MDGSASGPDQGRAAKRPLSSDGEQNTPMKKKRDQRGLALDLEPTSDDPWDAGRVISSSDRGRESSQSHIARSNMGRLGREATRKMLETDFLTFSKLGKMAVHPLQVTDELRIVDGNGRSPYGYKEDELHTQPTDDAENMLSGKETCGILHQINLPTRPIHEAWRVLEKAVLTGDLSRQDFNVRRVSAAKMFSKDVERLACLMRGDRLNNDIVWNPNHKLDSLALEDGLPIVFRLLGLELPPTIETGDAESDANILKTCGNIVYTLPRESLEGRLGQEVHRAASGWVHGTSSLKKLQTAIKGVQDHYNHPGGSGTKPAFAALLSTDGPFGGVELRAVKQPDPEE
ncbi:hypothetical protein N3K66_001703 [Trichothecium roseum]|uniref:Uncharacterized protein n=1 Tax=Trichothecium roseum TaxID=47278 RepID=A0ACC0V7B8_9HYPO|nr:hypothetical protein N3K66_001703 [Trichothecium roseum]